ncbi:hypothetical protein C8J57DRAFT_1254660 [Mycena rebaudengoi]|nr:hypothetical protein C8J57DRAFT_1254660 [Mycena rebaudengoi]
MASELNAFLETLFLDGTVSDVLPKRQIPQEELAPPSTKRCLRNGVGGGERRSGRARKTELVVDDDGAGRNRSECAQRRRTGSGWIAYRSAQSESLTTDTMHQFRGGLMDIVFTPMVPGVPLHAFNSPWVMYCDST